MKKRLLASVLTLSLVLPSAAASFSAQAAFEGIVTTETDEQTSEEAPAEAEEQIPEENPAETDEQIPAENPAETDEQIPAEAPAETDEQAPEENPAEAPTEADAQTPEENPAETNEQIPAETNEQIPADVISLRVPDNINFKLDPFGQLVGKQIYSDTYSFENRGDSKITLTLTDIFCTLDDSVLLVSPIEPDETVRASREKVIRLQLIFENGDTVWITEEKGEYAAVLDAGETLRFTIGGAMSDSAYNKWKDGEVKIRFLYHAQIYEESFAPSETDAEEASEPSETDEPSEADVPFESDAPSEADMPSESDAPSEADMPSESDAPSETDEPSEAE